MFEYHKKESPIISLLGMGGGIGSYVFTAADTGYEIARSLRFNDNHLSYLSFTPASAGNRRTFTLSFWCKLVSFGSRYATVLGTGTTWDTIWFEDDTFRVFFNTAVSANIQTTQLFRDPSAWYHFVVAVDTTQATASNRIKIYVNGSQITTFSASSYPSLDYECSINSTNQHTIGRNTVSDPRYFDGYLADVWFIDGQALEPSNFGLFDDYGVWQPKLYTGSKSGNSFHLPFSDNSSNSALGTDDSGNGNDWTVNNIAAGDGGSANNSWSGYFDGSGDDVRTPGSSAFSFGSSNWTAECWFYLTQSGGYYNPFQFNKSFGNYMGGAVNPDLSMGFDERISVTQVWSMSNGVSNTISLNKWTHYALVRNGNTITAYIDGSSICSTTYSGSHGTDYFVCAGSSDGSQYFPGYVSNLRVVKGTAVYTSSFTPPTSPLTAITNTSLLTLQSSTFVDNSTNNFTLTVNGNSAITSFDPFYDPASIDSLLDSPTKGTQSDTGVGGEVVGNYCTLNPLDKASTLTLSNGNLEPAATDNSISGVKGTIAIPTSGKFYAEGTAISWTASGYFEFGIALSTASNTDWIGVSSGTGFSIEANGTTDTRLRLNGTNITITGAVTSGDVLQVAVDYANSKIWLGKNNTWYDSSGGTTGNPATGSNATATLSATATYLPAVVRYGTSNIVSCNYGQRAFSYSAPSGFKSLNTANLPTPTIEDGSQYVGIVTGNFDTTKTWNVGFQPDLIWMKSRGNTDAHVIQDSVNGTGSYISIANTAAATSFPIGGQYGITSFNSNGWTQGSWGPISNTQMVAWCWKAGGGGGGLSFWKDGAGYSTASAAGLTGGDVTPTAASVGTEQGFSIIKYTGSGGSTGKAYPHGLGKVPKFYMIKNLTTANTNWVVYHQGLGNTKAIYFDGLGANTNDWWDNTSPTTNYFYTKSASLWVHTSGEQYIAYVWADVPGLQKFGVYTGNGSTDGTFVELGFRPAFVMLKSSTTFDWYTLFDSERTKYNPIGGYFDIPSSNRAEQTASLIDFLSNGFKLRFGSGNQLNGNGVTYIYAAFGEHPFRSARAR